MTLNLPSESEIHGFVRAVAFHNDAIRREEDFDDAEPPTSPTKRYPAAKRYVLIVEDDPDIRDVVMQSLFDCGYIVKTASNGDEALNLLDREYLDPQRGGDLPRLPSVILLDIMLPVMSGVEFYAILRRTRPQFAAVPVIIMSADHHINQFTKWAICTEGLDAPHGQLPKPFALGDLVEKVAAAAGLP